MSKGGKSLAALMKASETAAMERPRLSTPAEAPHQALKVKSISLTPGAEGTLLRVMDAARGRVGRKVSASAVVRALLDYCEREGLEGAIGAAIEAELNSGAVIWGGRRAL